MLKNKLNSSKIVVKKRVPFWFILINLIYKNSTSPLDTLYKAPTISI